MTYICKRCGKDKPESEYYWRVRNGKRQRNGARCKSCIREVERERSAQQLSQKHVRSKRAPWYDADAELQGLEGFKA